MLKRTIDAKIINNAKVIIVFLFDGKNPTLNPSQKGRHLLPLPFFGEGVRVL